MQCLSILPTSPTHTLGCLNTGVQPTCQPHWGIEPRPFRHKNRKTNRQKQTEKTIRQQDHKRTLLKYNGERRPGGPLSTDPSYKRFATKKHKNKPKNQSTNQRSNGTNDRRKPNGDSINTGTSQTTRITGTSNGRKR